MQLKLPKDIGQRLDSIVGLKYLTIVWSLIGTNPPKATQQLHWRILYYLYSAVINFLCAFCFTASIWINLFFIDSYKDLVSNLSLNISFSVSIIKQLAVLKHRQNLLRSNVFLKLLDKRSNNHRQDRRNILKAIRYSQWYSLCFVCYVFCGCGFGYIGWSNQRLIYNAWHPNLFSSKEKNYLAAFIYQFVSQVYIGLIGVFNDVYPLSYITLMNGHLESLAGRIARIGWNKHQPNAEENNIKELKNCIRDHLNLLRYFDCIRPLISITLFFQFLIAGLALGLTAINLTHFSSDFNEHFFAFIYLFLLLTQIFPCCWHVNALMEKSDYLTTAMYSCNWLDQSIKFRKILIIFMIRTQKTNTIMAGNLAPVTLQTFLSIIRFSFSMYTLFRTL